MCLFYVLPTVYNCDTNIVLARVGNEYRYSNAMCAFIYGWLCACLCACVVFCVSYNRD